MVNAITSRVAFMTVSDSEKMNDRLARGGDYVTHHVAHSGDNLHLRREIMGLFDGLLGGVVGAGMVSVINNLVEQQGGLQGLINKFQQQGLGETVNSWVSTGPNKAISPDDVHRALGPDLLQQLSAKSGLSVQDLAQKLSTILPEAVDTMTPNGRVPNA
jgi:uncharacterized protein YidB (DUF937 family)